MNNRIVNLIFPIILFALLCVAVIAVATAPRMTESGEAGLDERQTESVTEPAPAETDPDETLPDGSPTNGQETDAPAPETDAPAPETDAPVPETDPAPEEDPAAVTPSEPDPADETDAPAPDEPDPAEAVPDLPEPIDPAVGEPIVLNPDADGREDSADGENGDNAEAGNGEETPPFDVRPFDGSDKEETEPEPAVTDPGQDPAATEPEPSGDEPGTDNENLSVPAVVSASLDGFSPEVRAQIASMSTRELLTQMFIATYDGSWATAGYAAEYGFGGYITFAEDYENDTPQSFREGVDRVTASSKIPPLYAVDEEGGTVTRASKYSWYRRFPFLSPREVYESGGLDLIRTDAAEKAELLKTLGINYNLAPVADISVNSWDYMYNRSPGQDAETTASIVETIVSVFNARGVASTVKHFPGYGAVSDTHTAMAWDGRTVEELESFDLIPFRRAMEAGVPSVMVSHIITALDPERPASVSAKVVDYIRSNMGYDGVLITDDMRMNGILDFCTTGNGSLEAITAGYDLICCTNWPEQFPVVWVAVENGSLTRERLELSAARVLRMKQDLGIWVP